MPNTSVAVPKNVGGFFRGVVVKIEPTDDGEVMSVEQDDGVVVQLPAIDADNLPIVVAKLQVAALHEVVGKAIDVAYCVLDNGLFAPIDLRQTPQDRRESWTWCH